MRLYGAFYKQFGVRLIGHLNSPVLSPMQNLELPKESVLHHIPVDDLDIGPTPMSPGVSIHPGRVVLDHVTDLVNPHPVPRNNASMTPSRLETEYKRRFKKIRKSPNLVRSMRDDKTLAIYSYSGMVQCYLYQSSVFSNYFKWNNAIESAFKSIVKNMQLDTREHFIVLELPEQMPTVKMLRTFEKNYTEVPQKLVHIFSKPDYLMLSKLWTFIGPNRTKSTLSHYTVKDLSRLNFIVVGGTSWSVFNLGRLLEVFNADLTDDDELGAGNKTQQIRFYDYLVNVNNYGASNREVLSDSEDSDVSVTKVKETVVNDDIIEEVEVDDTVVEISDTDIESRYDLPDEIDDSEIEIELDNWKDDTNIEVDASDITFKHIDAHDKIKAKVDKNAENGLMSAAEYKRYHRLIEKSNVIPNPFGEGTLDDYRKITDADLSITEDDRKIPKQKGVIDDSLSKSSIHVMDGKYIKNVLPKDIINAAMAVQSADLIVTDLKQERVENAMNDYNVIRMKLEPIEGESSTITFRYPNVNPDGTYIANGVRYRLRKQRGDMPIRKVSSESVALTSYYGKLFVDRSEMAVVNYGKWITTTIRKIANDIEDNRVKTVVYGDNFFNDLELPRIYTIIAKYFKLIENDDVKLMVNYKERLELLDPKEINKLEKGGMTFCGFYKKQPMLVDKLDMFYVHANGGLTTIGTIETIFNLDATKAPVDIATFRLFSKNVPVGMVLGHTYGLSKLMALLEVTPRRVPVGTAIHLESDEYVLRFNDENLVFNKSNKVASLVLAGLNRYHRDLKKYSVDDFDDPEVFVDVLDTNGIKVGFVRELQLAMQMFVDPITLGILQEMKEPETLDGLILRSCELLTNDSHPDETDLRHMRIKGYERFSGAVYSEMVRAVRKFKSRGVAATAKIEMNPEAVWHAIGMDSAVSQVDELNPVETVREAEVVTYMGTGGRSPSSLVKRTRQFHKTDVGVISADGSTDSGTVGANVLLSPNANFKNLRGGLDEKSVEDMDNSSLVSTAALLSVGSIHDDPKRVNFAGIQHKHGVAIKGGTTPPLRTGYEKVLAHRTSDLFAYTAKSDCKVVEVTDNHVKLKNKDGTFTSVEIGIRHGNVSGVTVPQYIKANVTVGQSLKEGDVVSYNAGYFKVDPLDKKQVTYTNGTMVKLAMVEASTTYEDACEVSERVADAISTNLSHVRTITVDFKSRISNLVKPGAAVDYDSSLCLIEDDVIADNDLYNDSSIDLLKEISNNVPKAKYDGVVEKIEVYYHGDKEDMSPTIRQIVDTYDKKRVNLLKSLGKTPTTGAVDGSVRFGRDPLDLDTIVIKVYITETLKGGIGDKGVFCNQIKTIISGVMSGINKTESGMDIDAKFGYASFSARIALSPEIIGTTNTLLINMSKMVAETYFKSK